MQRLMIYYDAECGFCCRIKAWLASEPAYVALRFTPRQSQAVSAVPGLIDEARPDEMVVVDDAGGVYRGAAAYLMCLWALRRWRPWASRLASPTPRPFVRQACQMLARRRQSISHTLHLRPDAAVLAQLRQEQVATCATDEDSD